jgi:hypothetical protein
MQALPSGGFALGRQHTDYPNDIREGTLTITPEIFDEVAKQELTILNFFRLIDQKQFTEAYQMLDNPQLSLKEFEKQWKNYSLVDIDDIQTHQIFFRAYPATPQEYLKGIGNLNEFTVHLFLQTTDNTIQTNSINLQVIDNEKIQLNPNLDTPQKGEFGTKQLLTKLYYHLIATHHFKRAYEMQYSHSQTLEQFENTYKDIIGVTFKEYGEMYCDDTGCGSSHSDDE